VENRQEKPGNELAMGERAAKPDKKREIALAHASCLAPGTPATPTARGYGECPCPKE